MALYPIISRLCLNLFFNLGRTLLVFPQPSQQIVNTNYIIELVGGAKSDIYWTRLSGTQCLNWFLIFFFFYIYIHRSAILSYL